MAKPEREGFVFKIEKEKKEESERFKEKEKKGATLFLVLVSLCNLGHLGHYKPSIKRLLLLEEINSLSQFHLGKKESETVIR